MRAHAPVSLNVIRVAEPCPADWDAMQGDNRVRFCDECRLHVYNLSELTRPQAEQFIAEHEGRLCVRYYQRADGTIITRDCEGGLRRTMKRARRIAMTAASTVICAMLTPFGLASMSRSSKSDALETSQPKDLKGELAVMGGCPAPPRVPVLMGAIRPATQPATQPSTEPSE